VLLCVKQTVEAPYCKSLYLMSTNTFVTFITCLEFFFCFCRIPLQGL